MNPTPYTTPPDSIIRSAISVNNPPAELSFRISAFGLCEAEHPTMNEAKRAGQPGHEAKRHFNNMFEPEATCGQTAGQVTTEGSNT